MLINCKITNQVSSGTLVGERRLALFRGRKDDDVLVAEQSGSLNGLHEPEVAGVETRIPEDQDAAFKDLQGRVRFLEKRNMIGSDIQY